MTSMDVAVRAVLSLHCKGPEVAGDILGPYCAECISPIDGGPESYPCRTVNAVMDALCGAVRG